MTASCVALSSLSNSFWLTITMFFGSHASAVAKCDKLSHTFESTPVAPDDMNESDDAGRQRLRQFGRLDCQGLSADHRRDPASWPGCRRAT